MTGAGEEFLLCRIGSRIGALIVNDVREVMRPLPIEPLAGAPPFVLGLSIVRGFPIPVIDAGRLFGPIGLASPARFISLRLGERTASLAVDAVLDVRSLAPGAIADIPPLLGEAAIASAIGALDSKLLLVLEAARLVPESVWHSIGRPSSSGAFE